jgi:hypothetical protein
LWGLIWAGNFFSSTDTCPAVQICLKLYSLSVIV